MKKTDIVAYIIAFEQGELDNRETLELFSHLIATGKAWHLQGTYQRAASALIANGVIDQNGKILQEVE